MLDLSDIKVTRYSSDIRTFTVKHRLTLYSLEFVVNNLNTFLGTIFLLTQNCFFENKKLIVNICSPPVSPDGPNDEAQPAAGGEQEGGGGDEDGHQGAGDHTQAAGDDHQQPGAGEESGEDISLISQLRLWICWRKVQLILLCFSMIMDHSS